MNTVDKIAELSKALGVYLTYEYSLRIDAPGETFCSRNETYRLAANGYKTIYLPTYEQVLALTPHDFIKGQESI